MAWIHEQPDWPQFTWHARSLASRLADIRHRQGRLLGRMESLGFELRREASLETLTIEVVTSSAIEGERLDPQEVRSSIARRLGIEIGGDVPVGRDVEGIVEMMIDTTRHFDRPLTRERLFDWHAALFPTGRTGMRQITVGAWRPAQAGPMQGRLGTGRQGTGAFRGAGGRPARCRDGALPRLVRGRGRRRSGAQGRHRASLVRDRPSLRGNGRIARAIADMALARADGMRERFYSMSAQIETERTAYYAQLERQQRGSLDITGWLAWFLDCLGRALGTAEGTVAAVLYKAEVWTIAHRTAVNARQRRVLTRMRDPGFQDDMNTSTYAKLAKCANDTALRDIRARVDRGLLVKNPGGGRNTSYRLPASEEIGNTSGLSG